MQRMLGTADIPEPYWTDARVVGRIPFVACQLEPRTSYCMYVPKQHYKNDRAQPLPLIVSVHGSGGRAEMCREAMTPLADEIGAAVLAPLFPACLGDPNEMHGYKFLSSNGIRFDLTLLAMLDEVKVRWPKIDTDKVHLCGFSGGGQFTLRFFYLHPERLHSVCIGAPGLSTRLDRQVSWPEGIKDVHMHFDGRQVEVDQLQRIKVQLVVGANDISDVNIKLWRLLRKTMSPDSTDTLPGQLPNRREALEKLNEEFNAAGIRSKLIVVEGAAHDYQLVVPSMVSWIKAQLDVVMPAEVGAVADYDCRRC